MKKRESQKFPFTMARLLSLAPGDERYFVYDEKQPGLRLYVTPRGKKTFQFQYRSKSHGSILSRNLGSYPALSINEARSQAADLLSAVNAGVNIEQQKRMERRQRLLVPTVDEFAMEYLELHAKPNKKSWKSDERSLKVDILPLIGRLKIRDVKKRDLIEVIDKVADRNSLVMANRTYSLLSKLFAFAQERDVIELSPVQGLKKRVVEKSRERILNDDELRTLWNELGDGSVGMAIKFIIATGQRPGEVRDIEWREIQDNRWVIPAGRVKSGLVHVVPLPLIALSLLSQMEKQAEIGRYVFPGKRFTGEIYGNRCMADSTLIHHMGKIVKRLGWAENARPHDLRRTVRSNLAKIGVSKDIAERIVNHKERGIAATYDRYDYFEEKKAALDKWGRYLEAILITTEK